MGSADRDHGVQFACATKMVGVCEGDILSVVMWGGDKMGRG